MGKRYKALRIIGTIYKILGVMVAAFTIVASMVIFVIAPFLETASYETTAYDWVGIIFLLFYGGLSAVGLYAIGELIYLMLALEENTRKTVNLLEKQISLSPSELQGK